MSTAYRTLPQIKFAAFRELESRRVESSDRIWAMLVGAQLAAELLKPDGESTATLADRYPTIPHIQRLNLTSPRARTLLLGAESDVCTMSMNFAFALHEDFLRSCLTFLVPQGLFTTAQVKNINSVDLHEEFERATAHAMDVDALNLYHLTRLIRNAHTHRGGLVNAHLVEKFESVESVASQKDLWTSLTGEAFSIPALGDAAAISVGGLIASLAIQKRLSYDVNIGLQRAIPRSVWADIAAEEYFEASAKSPKDPSALRSLKGYLRGGFAALNLNDAELIAAISRRK